MSEFRLMTWNVQNLFETGDDSGSDTQEELDAKIESLRAEIDEPNWFALGCLETLECGGDESHIHGDHAGRADGSLCVNLV